MFFQKRLRIYAKPFLFLRLFTLLKIQKMKTINYVLLLIGMVGFTTCSPKNIDIEPQSNPFPPKIWDKTLGGNQDDNASSIIATSDGGFLIVGSSNSTISGDKTENNIIGTNDYWIVKINSSGQKVWDKTIGGSDNDIAKSIIATSDGGFIVAGNSSSGISGDKTEASNRDKNGNTNSDYWLVKINSLGQKVWDKTFGTDNQDYLRSIVATQDGGFIAIGTSYTPKPLLNISNYTDAGDYYGDCYLVKIDNSGKKIWETLSKGKYREGVKSAIVTSDEDIVISSGSFPVQIDISTFNLSYRILKINRLGEIQWEKLVPSEGWTTNSSLMATQNGNFVIGSNFDKEYTKITIKYGFWISEIDKSGNQLWKKTYTGNSSDILTSMVKTNDGGFLIVGNSNSGKSGDKTDDNKGEFDYWLLKTDNKGNKIWDKSVGGKQEENAQSIITTNDGCVILGTSSSDISGDKSEKSRGGTDYWLVKLGFQ
jgi:hypothetical protein